MDKVKITVLKCFSPNEEPFVNLVKQANIHHVQLKPQPFGACEIFRDGQEIVVNDLKVPEGFCGFAWHVLFPHIRTLAAGGNLPWFKEKGVAIMCCHDALRPVTFKLERI